ncbi:MAG: HD domain-containing protein [Oscillospiraceae bacterium]|nr:HD domain-containing protein [Oscillospiraceae bacterium]
MREDLIKKTEEFVKEKFDGGRYLTEHPEAKRYRLAHTYRVANVGRDIARAEGFDETEFVIACLLHDVSYCEEFGEDGWREHGRTSARIARPFLRSLGLPEDRVADICFGIAIHVDDEADFEGERTAFARSVCDADNIDRFDAYRIHENLAAAKYTELGPAEQREHVESRLAQLRSFLDIEFATATARELWRQRIEYYIGFYEKLLAQLDRSEKVL